MRGFVNDTLALRGVEFSQIMIDEVLTSEHLLQASARLERNERDIEQLINPPLVEREPR